MSAKNGQVGPNNDSAARAWSDRVFQAHFKQRLSSYRVTEYRQSPRAEWNDWTRTADRPSVVSLLHRCRRYSAAAVESRSRGAAVDKKSTRVIEREREVREVSNCDDELICYSSRQLKWGPTDPRTLPT